MADEIVQVDVFEKLGVEKYEDDDYVKACYPWHSLEPLEKRLEGARGSRGCMAKQAAETRSQAGCYRICVSIFSNKAIFLV